jgi:hypothetical protein
MGIRDTAMSSRDEEPESYGDFGFREALKYPKPGKQPDLFENGYQRSYLPDIRPKGSLTIEISIPLRDIGQYADPEDPNYDYFRAVDEAEDMAMKQIEIMAGSDVKQRYHVDMSSQDDYFGIIVTATLTPNKHN